MPKLQINADDDTVVIPRTVAEDGKPRKPIVLHEPNMPQMAEIATMANEADGVIPPIHPIATDAKPEELAAMVAQVRERTIIMFGNVDTAPYGQAILRICKMLAGEEVSPEDLPGWVMSPRCLNKILEHFQNPLPGEE